MENSTIAAIATSGGRGAIGIIKLSGSKALAIASAIFCPAEGEHPRRPGQQLRSFAVGSRNGFESHRLHYGHIYDHFAVEFEYPALGLRVGFTPASLPHEQWKTTNVKQRLVSDANFDTEPIDCFR